MRFFGWKYWALLSVVAWHFNAPAVTLEKFKPIKLYDNESQTPDNPNRPTIADVRKIRKEYKIRSLDKLLEKLKLNSKYQRLFRKPTLMFKSDSLLEKFVSETFPRAIFHVDGFLMAFITDPNAGWAYETVEMAEFEPQTSHWKAERLTFGAHPSDLKSCESCHGTPYTPKWGSYGMWVGTVGGFFDFLSMEDETRLKNWRDSQSLRLSWVAGLFQPEEKPNFNLTAHVNALQMRSLMSDIATNKIYDRYVTCCEVSTPIVRISMIFFRRRAMPRSPVTK